MTAIWSTDPEGRWKLQSTVGFPDEATLHSLVEVRELQGLERQMRRMREGLQELLDESR